jgi:hypothetical protein
MTSCTYRAADLRGDCGVMKPSVMLGVTFREPAPHQFHGRQQVMAVPVDRPVHRLVGQPLQVRPQPLRGISTHGPRYRVQAPMRPCQACSANLSHHRPAQLIIDHVPRLDRSTLSGNPLVAATTTSAQQPATSQLANHSKLQLIAYCPVTTEPGRDRCLVAEPALSVSGGTVPPCWTGLMMSGGLSAATRTEAPRIFRCCCGRRRRVGTRPGKRLRRCTAACSTRVPSIRRRRRPCRSWPNWPGGGRRAGASSAGCSGAQMLAAAPAPTRQAGAWGMTVRGQARRSSPALLLPMIRPLLDDPDQDVRDQAVGALRRCGGLIRNERSRS